MKVIYDISVLGNGFYIPRARTGIFRVVENLAEALAEHQVITMYSSQSADNYFFCLDYLQSNKNLNSLPLVKPELRFGMTAGFIDLYRNVQKKRHTTENASFLLRAANRLLHESSKIFVSDAISTDALLSADIYHSPFYPIPRQIKKHKQIKTIITLYDLIPLLYPQFFQFNENHLIGDVVKSIDENTWITSISHATKNDLCNYLPSLDPNRVFVTHLAASSLFYPCDNQEQISAVKLKFGIPEGSYILSLSTLEPRKNIIQTIKCFSRLVEEQSITDLCLVLVGTKGWDFDAIFNEIATNSKTRDRIIVTGYVPDENLAALYSGAMMFVYPSFYEGFGLPPLEAMQCGTPVITSNTSSLPEVVGNAGVMVEPTDEQALCQAMLEIYSSSELRQKMAESSLQQAAKFSWKRCAEQTMDAYNAAMGS